MNWLSVALSSAYLPLDPRCLSTSRNLYSLIPVSCISLPQPVPSWSQTSLGFLPPLEKQVGRFILKFEANLVQGCLQVWPPLSRGRFSRELSGVNAYGRCRCKFRTNFTTTVWKRPCRLLELFTLSEVPTPHPNATVSNVSDLFEPFGRRWSHET